MSEGPMGDEPKALKPLMTVDEVAKYVGRTPTTIYSWIRTGKLATSQPGGPKSPHLIHVSDVDALLAPKVKTKPPEGGAT